MAKWDRNLRPALAKLNPRQRLFLLEYVAGGCTSEALEAAGKAAKYKFPNRVLGRRLMREALNELMGEASARAEMSAEQIVGELATLARANITDVVIVEEGQVKVRNSSDWPESVVPAVTEVQETTAGLKLKLADKLKALDILAKINGLYSDAPSVTLSLESVLERIDERARGGREGGEGGQNHDAGEGDL